MCLKIDNTVNPKKTDEDGFCMAWKVITKDNIAPYFPEYYPHSRKYQIGNNFSSRKSVNLNLTELEDMKLNSGFHLFLDRESAREELAFWVNYKGRGYCKIIKVYYKPKDVVKYGKYEEANAVVVTKLTVKSLDRVK